MISCRSGMLTAVLMLTVVFGVSSYAGVSPELKRRVVHKPSYDQLPLNQNLNEIIFKLAEGMGQPEFNGTRFLRSGEQWDRLNAAISSSNKVLSVRPHFQTDKAILDQMRIAGSTHLGTLLPDLSLYHRLILPESMSSEDRLARIKELNALDIIEIAYFAPIPELASTNATEITPAWQSQQYYLQPAPTGLDAYYAWGFPGGRGEGVKVVDIEGNWIETHEDLHGGTDNFHIAGTVINDAGWWNHGTAVLGEIASDSNNFGMTGIAYNVDLGTVSIGSMSTSDALITATNNSDTGDVILIELHAPGPHYNFDERPDQLGYVCMEYWQDNFDAILTATSLGRIVVEAGGNGAENFDDVGLYGSLFDPNYRFSGAIIVGASDASHYPASFTNYGQRVDVHGFGTWDVYTLGYGDLYGSSPDNNYTSSFAGTSSASPIIVGACACLQGVHLATHGRILYHDEMRNLLTTYSTPQTPNSRHIGPLPNLQGSVDEIIGVSFTADTTIGWVPYTINFTASSGLSVDTWTWDFGDGDSSFIQSPAHIYSDQGMFNVKLEINAGGDVRSAERVNYVVALADTMLALDADGSAGEMVEVTVYARNTIPIRFIQIPIEYAGDLELDLDSFSTAGCRTDQFEEGLFIHEDSWLHRKTIKLTSSSAGTTPDMQPGTGPIVKLYFTIAPSAQAGQTTTIQLDGYTGFTPEFEGPILQYEPRLGTGIVSICLPHGDMDGVAGISVSDLTYLVEYLFNSGPNPLPIEAGDLNCNGDINIEDLTMFVDYLFLGGEPPCGC